MSDVVIKVENLSKQYRLGTIGTGTLAHDLNRVWSRVRGKEDPYLKIGQINDRTKKAESDYVWAIEDINFEVRQGEVLGIIGRNGAGKSTLLKILSQITRPTTGSVKMKGRVGSLLEVGTGFHHELTGRENIYINGAILGMRRHEIDRKLDEIIDFAGVERYIDTPVKRYSSGMMVRLGFSVAAHLEPEILIVDEVLAVGDADFQKKCMGKMGEVSKLDGKTILFVSHNLGAIENLCSRAILLKQGRLEVDSDLNTVLGNYLTQKEAISDHIFDNKLYPSPYKSMIKKISFKDKNGESTSSFAMGEDIWIEVSISLKESFKALDINLRLDDMHGVGVAGWRTKESGYRIGQSSRDFRIILHIKNLNIFDGRYKIDMNLSSGNEIIDRLEDLQLEIYAAKLGMFGKVVQKTYNLIYTDCEWRVEL